MKKFLFILWFATSLTVYAQQALKLTYPNGGEQLVAGTDVEILWEGVSPQDTVVLEYSVDSGVRWNSITTKATGLRYLWNVPNAVSDNCLIHIQTLPQKDINNLWARQAGSNNYDIGKDSEAYSDMAVDDSGNIYICGAFTDKVDFGNGIILESISNTDALVAKYSPQGEIIWARQASGKGANYHSKIVLDKLGNLYVTGAHKGDEGFSFESDTSFSTTGEINTYIAQYTTDGEFNWVRNINGIRQGGTQFDKRPLSTGYFGTAIAVDSSGYVYWCGLAHDLYQKSTYDYRGFDTMFVSKLNINGEIIWNRKVLGEGVLTTNIAFDKRGALIITGSFSGEVNFDGKVKTNSGVYWDAFTAKLDMNGDFVWLNTVDGMYHQNGIDITTDLEGNVIIVGEFSEDTDFGQGFKLNVKQSPCIFIAKYNLDGILLWVKSIIGEDGYIAGGITCDTADNIFICSTFRNIATIDNGVIVTSNGERDFLIAAYKGSGDYLWAKSFGSTGNDHSADIKVDKYMNFYLCGNFTQTVDFNKNTRLTSLGVHDAFLVKFFVEEQPIQTDTSDGFFSIISPDKNLVYISDTSVYAGKRANIVVQLNGNSSITIAQQKPTGFKARIAYQNSILTPFKKIPGATVLKGNGVDTLNITGNWNATNTELASIPITATLGDRTETALELLSFNWLNDAGEILNYNTELQDGVFTILGICAEGGERLYDINGQAQMMSVAPHPANGVVIINFETIERGETRLMLTDVLGQQTVLKSGNFEKGNYSFEFDTENLASGIYMLTMQTPTQIFTQQVIIHK
ncbi:MAG: T9SS type A sorting domain-containing protein [Bacteroidota bacterium]